MDQNGVKSALAALLLLLIVAGMSTGCADRQGPLRVNGISRTSTISSDSRQAPRGQTIPPAGIGVDLVRSRNNDPALKPVGYDGQAN